MKFFPASVLLLLIPNVVAAAVVEHNFNTYPSGGTGWQTNWSTIAATSTVVTSGEMTSGGGNYVTLASSSPTTAANHGARRELSSSVIDTSQPYTVSFNYRLDDANLTTFTTFSDRLHVGMSTGVSDGTGANFSWNVGAVGSINSARWFFYDRSNGDYNASNMRDSGMTLTVGVVYSFLISVDPASQTYSASITNNSTSITETEVGMEFRNQSSAATNYLLAGFFSEVGESRGISLDSVVITGVPEPTTAVLVGACGALGFLRRRRA